METFNYNIMQDHIGIVKNTQLSITKGFRILNRVHEEARQASDSGLHASARSVQGASQEGRRCKRANMTYAHESYVNHDMPNVMTV